MKIGVVGFSRNQFDKKMALLKFRKILEELLEQHEKSSIEIVSGYTSMGVPLITYQLADDMDLVTVGFSAKQALNVKSGLYPVKKAFIFGEYFGDESKKFIEYIDILIRIGGGSQSRYEVELFKKKQEGRKLSGILFEEEVDWYGR